MKVRVRRLRIKEAWSCHTLEEKTARGKAGDYMEAMRQGWYYISRGLHSVAFVGGGQECMYTEEKTTVYKGSHAEKVYRQYSSQRQIAN